MAGYLYLLVLTALACTGREASSTAHTTCTEPCTGSTFPGRPRRPRIGSPARLECAAAHTAERSSCERVVPYGSPFSGMLPKITVNKSYSCEGLGLTEIPEHLPVTTEILDFSFNLLPALQNSTFSKLNSLLSLDLTRSAGCLRVPSTTTTGCTLTGNLLLFLSDTAFVGPQSLKQLVLTQTGISKLSFIPMTNLGSLDTLILGSNHISSLQLPPNFPTQNLHYLDFQMNNIRTISAEDVNILQKTSNITLIFKGNDILYIEPGAFQSSFYRVDFGGCINIRGILAGMQNSSIQTLWLGTFNDVEKKSYLSPDNLQSLCNITIQDLYLQLRHFENLNAATFRCMTRLRKLDLTHTHISTLPPDISGMKVLTELVLNENFLEHLCNASAAAFPSLTHLHLRGNTHTLQLGSGCLQKASKLQHLDLSHSRVESSNCCSEALSGLSSLRYLNLSYNSRLHVADELFREGANLEVLDIAFTQMHISTSQGPFQNLHLLQVLNLSSSQVNSSIPYLFQGLERLMVLDLSRNIFESGIMPKSKLLQPLTNLEVLILASCELTAIDGQAFHILKKLRYVDLSHNKLTTFSTDAFSHLKSIYLNFAHNRIQIIQPDKLVSLPGHSVINLSYNPLECTCSNIGLITWYKENLDKIEDPEETTCSEPKSLAGAQLTTVTLYCGISTMGIIATVLGILFCVAIFIWSARSFRRRYQQI